MSSRYSNEDAVKRIPNRFQLVLVASQRVRELRRGLPSTLKTSNGPSLTALQEIAEGNIGLERLARIDDRSVPADRSKRR